MTKTNYVLVAENVEIFLSSSNGGVEPTTPFFVGLVLVAFFEKDDGFCLGTLGFVDGEGVAEIKTVADFFVVETRDFVDIAGLVELMAGNLSMVGSVFVWEEYFGLIPMFFEGRYVFNDPGHAVVDGSVFVVVVVF